MKVVHSLTLTLLLAAGQAAAAEPLWLPSIFSENHGAPAGDAGADLGPGDAGEDDRRDRLRRRQEARRRLYSNVLVGEFWLFCGKSNMMHPLNACAERDDAVARAAAFPLIRIAQVGSRDPQETTAAREETLGYWGPVKW